MRLLQVIDLIGCTLEKALKSRTSCRTRGGWIDSAADWIKCRQLRYFMIHEYVRDMPTLAAALSRGHLALPLLKASAQRLAAEVLSVASSTGRPGVI